MVRQCSSADFPVPDSARICVRGTLLGDLPPGQQISQLHPHADERREEAGEVNKSMVFLK